MPLMRNEGSGLIGTRKMTKKLVFLGVIVAVVVFGAVNWSKSFSGSVTNVIENVENFYSNDPNEVPKEEALGIVEFNNGVTYNQLAPNVLQEKIVQVTPAQLVSISWEPVTLLANPGTGYVYDIKEIVGFRRFSSESWAFESSNDESLEIKWQDVAKASGYNGAQPIGASLSRGFITGGANSTIASPAVEIWRPSALRDSDELNGQLTDGFFAASRQYEPAYFASRSTAVILTGSTSFTSGNNIANKDSEINTRFYFRIIYRLINLNF